MSCYVSSNDNRFYVAGETAYGAVASIEARHRVPALRLRARQAADRVQRRDKTGSRTFAGLPAGVRTATSFEMATYLTSWSDQTREPGYGPLFRATLGGAGKLFASTTAAGSSGLNIQFSSAHNLSVGQAITIGGEMRFVIAIVNPTTVQVNAPFTGSVASGTAVGSTMSYAPATDLASASLYDYWSPATTVHRILSGAAVDQMRVKVNADFHEFEFRGPAKDVIDSASFESGQGGLTQFPEEPAAAGFDYSIIPGHLGQVWLGSPANRLYTLTEAELVVDNNIDTRDREFGLKGPMCIAGGQRSVKLSFSIFEMDTEATKALYQAARQRSPITAMFQLGQQAGQMFGFYMNNVVPEVPEFDDSEARLQWKFTNCQAQGGLDDELFVAFG
jgi:hypothetical protein